jgi:hypothetical protein
MGRDDSFCKLLFQRVKTRVLKGKELQREKSLLIRQFVGKVIRSVCVPVTAGYAGGLGVHLDKTAAAAADIGKTFA